MEQQTYPSALRNRGRAWLLPMALVSFALHGGVVAGIYYLASLAPRLAPPPQSVLVTKLVRLGEVRPKDYLPQKETPPPPPPPPPPASIAPAVAPQPVPPVPPAARALEKKPDAVVAPKNDPNSRGPSAPSDAATSALQRLKKQFGAKDGNLNGDVSDADMQVIGNRYLTELTKCLRANFEVQGLNKGSVGNLSAKFLVRIRRDGTIISARVTQSSGDERFDRFAERAAEKCHKISPPPPELRSEAQSGVGVIFSPFE